MKPLLMDPGTALDPESEFWKEPFICTSGDCRCEAAVVLGRLPKLDVPQMECSTGEGAGASVERGATNVLL